MAMGSASRAFREIRSLYEFGPLGGATDARLIEMFLRSEGTGREEAFSTLVRRHAPMVLGICRRMLRGSPDADDAFQAVFLVMARKAHSLRRADALRPWLYGVSVRVAKAARRRAARRRAREVGLMDASAIAAAPDEDRPDLIALMDEEIDRLPARYREPLILCELEGLSRRDAASRLGLPEGTLSSRLARGRSLLRERLTRRGVTPGAVAIAALLAETASAAPSAAMADSATRLALTFAAGGPVPPSVASLAEGAIRMILASRMKLVALAVALGGLATGFAIASPPAREAPPVGAIREIAPAPVVLSPDPDPSEVRGVVVDEAGKPLAGAEVRLSPFAYDESLGRTAGDGSFALKARDGSIRGRVLLARSADGARAGLLGRVPSLTNAESARPVRLVARPAKAVVARVADADGRPVPGSTVQAAGLDYFAVAEATTGDDGAARLLVPSDAPINWIVAQKKGLGFDYAEFGPFDGHGRTRGGLSAADLPAAVDLRLGPARTVKIRAVDPKGEPLAGVQLYVWLIRKEGKQGDVNYSSRLFFETTNARGIATFDWLPPNQQFLAFFPATGGYAHRRILVEPDQDGLITAKLARTETLRGRVTLPDGSPAADVEVFALGTGHEHDSGYGRARTAADGAYAMDLSPNEGYAVYVDDREWAARSRLDVVIRPGQPVDGIDFTLRKGTVVRGSVTVGPANLPLANVFIRLGEDGGEPPKDARPDDRTARTVHRSVHGKTDEQGRYRIRVGPGNYTLDGPPKTEPRTLAVTDQAEIVSDFHLDRPEKGAVTGRVAGPDGKPIAGATVEVYPATMTGSPFTVTCDDRGRFSAERPRDRLYLRASSPDRALGEIAEVGADEEEATLVLAPTASATGILHDADGKPAGRRRISCGTILALNEDKSIFTHALGAGATTDEDGRFTLPGLVVGREYLLTSQRGNQFLGAGSFKTEKPGPIDLGTVRLGSVPR